MVNQFLSLCVGSFVGFLYGFSFLVLGKKTLSVQNEPESRITLKKRYSLLSMITFIRIALFGTILYLLLLSGMIHFILFLTAFLITFWLLIILQKV